jgi:hypothetical protein
MLRRIKALKRHRNRGLPGQSRPKRSPNRPRSPAYHALPSLPSPERRGGGAVRPLRPASQQHVAGTLSGSEHPCTIYSCDSDCPGPIPSRESYSGAAARDSQPSTVAISRRVWREQSHPHPDADPASPVSSRNCGTPHVAALIRTGSTAASPLGFPANARIPGSARRSPVPAGRDHRLRCAGSGAHASFSGSGSGR